MKEFPIDPKISELWKQFPLRIPGPSLSNCCQSLTALVQGSAGGVTVSAEGGTVDLETATGTAVIEEGEAAGTSVDADTGEVTISSEEGSVTFETVTGTATIEEGASATTSKDCTDTCQISLGAEDGTVEFETTSGKVVIEDGEAAGTRVDEETGGVTVTAEEGTIAYETNMGIAVMDEGVVVGSFVDMDTGEVSVSAVSGTAVLETEIGTISVEEGSFLGATVDAETREVTVTGVGGDVTITTEDGATTDVDTGASLGTCPVAHEAAATEYSAGVMNESGSEQASGGQEDSDEQVDVDGDGVVDDVDALPGDPDGLIDADGDSVNDSPSTDASGNPTNSTDFQQSSFNADADSSGTVIEDNDGDGVGADIDPDDWNANVTGVDVDGDGVDAAIDPDDNNANVTGVDVDGDGVDAAVDTDDWNANVTGVDVDEDGVDAAIDPDDEDADLQTKAAPVMLDFTELPFQVEASFNVNGVNFHYLGNTNELNAFYNYDPIGEPTTNGYVQGSSLVAHPDGLLTLTFDTPTPLLNFGFALSADIFLNPGVAVFLYDTSDTLINILEAGTIPDIWTEGQFNYVGTPVARAEILFNDMSGSIETFALDNLYYSESDKFFDDFESASIGPWWVNRTNSPYATTSFGPIVGRGGSGDNFAVVHTGKSSAANEGILGMDLNFTESAFRKISFDYNFVTTEFGQSSPQDDYFEAHLHLPNGDTQVLLKLSYSDVINGTGFTSVTGLPTDILDSTNGGQTGWLFYEGTIFIPDGLTTFGFHVFDVGNDNYDSALLIDNVLDPIVEIGADESPISSTDYMLTFARMLRGEIDPHDADLEADAVASEEHQAFIAKVNEVISDMENISDSELIAGKDGFLDRLWVARDTLADHEDTMEFLQQAGVAHHLLDASIMTDDSLGGNLAAIKDSIDQAKTFLVAHINDFGETDALANIRTNIDSVLANIDNVNNNEFTTATIVAIRNGIKQAFSDTIDHMSADGHDCITGDHLDCEQTL